MMSFQASGPHSNDRALEAVAMGYQEMTRFPDQVTWDKPMGKFNIVLDKEYNAISKGIGVVIGCSTFPVWNTVPGVFANLVCGNPVIVKPHPKATMPIAIVVAEIQKVFAANNVDPNTCQLGADSSDELITKDLAEHADVKLIDFTGNAEFGNYLEALPGKTVFTEKTGVNSVILDSVDDLDAVLQNLAFSVSLYSGQMCTAPQNFYVPENGIDTKDGNVSYDDVVKRLGEAIQGLATHPKMGAGTLAAVQNDMTLNRVKDAGNLGGNLVVEGNAVENEEFSNARTCSPALIEVAAGEEAVYEKELFGPIAIVIKTSSTEESVAIARRMAATHGAITCAAYTTSTETEAMIKQEMNKAFTPVSFNLTGFIWVNQHAAFSDFHVTGGNPAGNASFTDPLYINRRFVWVGNRKLVQ
jgi:phenylacetic acid degradation protein paaN